MELKRKREDVELETIIAQKRAHLEVLQNQEELEYEKAITRRQKHSRDLIKMMEEQDQALVYHAMLYSPAVRKVCFNTLHFTSSFPPLSILIIIGIINAAHSMHIFCSSFSLIFFLSLIGH